MPAATNLRLVIINPDDVPIHCPHCGVRISPDTCTIASDILWCDACTSLLWSDLRHSEIVVKSPAMAPYVRYVRGLYIYTPAPHTIGIQPLHQFLCNPP